MEGGETPEREMGPSRAEATRPSRWTENTYGNTTLFTTTPTLEIPRRPTDGEPMGNEFYDWTRPTMESEWTTRGNTRRHVEETGGAFFQGTLQWKPRLGGTHMPASNPRQQKEKTKRRRGKRGGLKHKKRDGQPKGELGKGIYNLSTRVLTEGELLALDKGLKYAPSKTFDEFKAYVDLNKFMRKLNIKRFFLNKGLPDTNPSMSQADFVHTKLKNNSLFNPPNVNNHHMEVFKQLMIKEIKKLGKRKMKYRREQRMIKDGIQSLKKDEGIIIKPADKGGGLVILDTKDYKEEMRNLLSDGDTYEKLPGDPTREYKKQLELLTLKGKHLGILCDKEYEFLIPMAPRIATIYYLPKIHKNQEKPPGRPIISGIDSLTSRLGSYLDTFIQPVVVGLPSYIKDSSVVIKLFKDLIPGPDMFLATTDVSSLYTIIPPEKGMRALEHFLKEETEMKSEQYDYLLECFEFALTHNYFWYEDTFFLQKRGVAMGAKFAPGFANLFMGLWEEHFIYSDRPKELLVWRRYIDDIIIVWKGARCDLEKFLVTINCHWGVVLTTKISDTSIEFLDLEITKETDRFSTKTFFKKTDRNGYFPTDSCHHPTWIRNVPTGQFGRVRRNCDKDEDYVAQSMVLKERFREKGYKEEELEDTRLKIGNRTQESFLHSKEKTESEETVSYITDFHSNYRAFNNCLKKHWGILKEDPILTTLISERPNVIYRRAPTLRDQITRSYIGGPKKKRPTQVDLEGQVLSGFHYCYRCMGCRTTQNKTKRSCFSKKESDKTHKIEDFITCSTDHVVYCVECPCGKLYVGRTTRPLQVRIREHIYNIKKKLVSHNLSSHFLTCHDSDPKGLNFWGIAKLETHWRGSNNLRELSKMESYWIYKLETLEPHGLNVEFDLNCFINNS